MSYCKEVREEKADWLLGNPANSAPDPVRAHLGECAECSSEAEVMQRLMRAMDAWEAPEPNAYFLTRFAARLDEERIAEPVGWLTRLFRDAHAHLHYGVRWRLQPVAVVAFSVMVVVAGGGVFLTRLQPAPEPTPAVVPVTPAVLRDLQSLNTNAPALNTLESLSGTED